MGCCPVFASESASELTQRRWNSNMLICVSHKMLEGKETSLFVTFTQVVASFFRLPACARPPTCGNPTIQVVLKSLFLHYRGLTGVFENGYYSSPEVASDALTVHLRMKARVCKESARVLIRSQSQDYFKTCEHCWVSKWKTPYQASENEFITVIRPVFFTHRSFFNPPGSAGFVS